jgi:hypothetical protein
MSVYQLPRLNKSVRYQADQPRTFLRFGPGGGLVLLHVTDDPTLTAKAWQTQPLQLGLYGTTLVERGPEVPPVLCARLGEGPVLSAPACILEMGNDQDIYEWLNARPPVVNLRLVLLRLDASKPGEAIMEASRRIWDSRWAEGDTLLRLRLEQQFMRTVDEDAGEVQFAGRELVRNTTAKQLLYHADFRLLVDPPSTQTLFLRENVPAELVVHNN